MIIEFKVHSKLTLWAEETHQVEVENKEEFIKKLKEVVEQEMSTSSDIDCEFDSFKEQHYIDETEEYMFPSENNMDSTLEVYMDGQNDPIAVNGKND